MISITEKEKQYLLGVDCNEFVEGLYSKSIFYELLQYDIGYKNNDTKFKIVTVIGLYNFIVNIIDSNVPEALNLRHHSTNKTRQFKIYRCLIIDFYIRYDNDFWQFNPNEYFQKDYEYRLKFNNMIPLTPHQTCEYVIRDTLLLKEILMFNHSFKIPIDNNNDLGDFISKMLILYNDFVDNIPL